MLKCSDSIRFSPIRCSYEPYHYQLPTVTRRCQQKLKHCTVISTRTKKLALPACINTLTLRIPSSYLFKPFQFQPCDLSSKGLLPFRPRIRNPPVHQLCSCRPWQYIHVLAIHIPTCYAFSAANTRVVDKKSKMKGLLGLVGRNVHKIN